MKIISSTINSQITPEGNIVDCLLVHFEWTDGQVYERTTRYMNAQLVSNETNLFVETVNPAPVNAAVPGYQSYQTPTPVAGSQAAGFGQSSEPVAAPAQNTVARSATSNKRQRWGTKEEISCVEGFVRNLPLSDISAQINAEYQTNRSEGGIKMRLIKVFDEMIDNNGWEAGKFNIIYNALIATGLSHGQIVAGVGGMKNLSDARKK